MNKSSNLGGFTVKTYFWGLLKIGWAGHGLNARRARGSLVYCNLMVTTMVDSNEMFVNEAIHQGTDMRHPMCPNAIFRTDVWRFFGSKLFAFENLYFEHFEENLLFFRQLIQCFVIL